MKAMNTRGIKEKRLYEAINGLVKEDIFKNSGIYEIMDEEIKKYEDYNEKDNCVFHENDSHFR